MRQILLFALVALAIGALVPRFYAAAPTAAPQALATPAAPPDNSRSVTIARSRDGHFHTEAVVDGRRISFLIDTGASLIALRERDAARLGIHPAWRDYSARVSTANGTVRAARVELNRVEVGGMVVRDVKALVLPDEALGQNLLGMSFLSRLRWQQRDGKLVLEQ